MNSTECWTNLCNQTETVSKLRNYIYVFHTYGNPEATVYEIQINPQTSSAKCLSPTLHLRLTETVLLAYATYQYV